MKNNKYIKGFTLAELAIVIAVIAILIIFVVPNLGKIAENSEGSSALSKAKDLYAQYVIDNSKEGFIDDELYVEVEDGYVHYLNGDPVKNGETYLVNQIFINDDVLSSSGKYVESPFKTHESIKEEFLKDFKLYARSYRYDFDKSDPLNIHNALNDEASKLVDLTVGENTEKISIAEAFILRETNPKKFVKWSWLYDLIKTEAEEELSNEAIIKNICSFLLDGNTDLEPNVFEGVDFSNYYGEYYEDIPRDDFLNNVDTEIPSFTINFDLAGGEWIDIDSVVNEYQEGEVIVLNNPTKNGYNFLGWYDENDNQVTELTMPDKEVSLEAKWELVEYTITYDLDSVELVEHVTIEEIIAEFLIDFNAARNKSHTPKTFYQLGMYEEIGDAYLFMYNDTYKNKWGWLAEYIKTITVKNEDAWNDIYSQKASTASKFNALDSSYIYSIAYELRGFVGQKQYTNTYGSIYDSANYGLESIQEQIWNHIPDRYKYIYEFKYSYTVETETFDLPTIVNSNFTGWYNGSTKVTTINKGTTGNITLIAKWKGFVGDYVNSIPLAYYSNTGLAASNISASSDGSVGNGKNYICDREGIRPNVNNDKLGNSLTSQNKILLAYDAEKNAYKVVAKNSASAQVAANSMGVTWTHAICSISNNIQDLVTVGQYIVIETTSNFSAYEGQRNKGYSLTDTYAYIYNADQYK